MSFAPYWTTHLIPTAIDPNTLSWEVKFDGRSLASVPVGGTVSPWPDSSGNSRDANLGAGNPVRRNSPNVKPVCDFISTPGSGMFFSLPVGGIDSSLGLSFYTYYNLQSVPNGSGGAFDGQEVFGSDIIHGFTMFASAFVALNNMQVGFRTEAATLLSGIQATTGSHLLTAICHPPNDGTGVVNVYYDGNLAVSGNWSAKPGTTGLLSGNSGFNVWLRGTLAFAGFGRRADSNATRKGIEAFLRGYWG